MGKCPLSRAPRRSGVGFAVGEVGDRCGGVVSSVPLQAIPDRRARGGWRILNRPWLARDISPREKRRSSRSSQAVNWVEGRQRPPPWKNPHPCPGPIPPRHGRWQESPRAEPRWREGTPGAIPRSRSNCGGVGARRAPTQRYPTGLVGSDPTPSVPLGWKRRRAGRTIPGRSRSVCAPPFLSSVGPAGDSRGQAAVLGPTGGPPAPAGSPSPAVPRPGSPSGRR